ncbi:CASP-like protein 1D2 isoform X1 [Capsella rubella]|uniref:CASP-like protein 1D2 isoform X1 n=2 Tax=Capsella rubella TaxID=81985 RepID=UPI000CD55B3D|nr:CASP-like protein 1D2 isoform X1 [Capsella rubella]
MASIKNPDPETGKSETIPESAVPVLPPPPPPSSDASFLDCRKIDVITRVLLFSATLTALIVMVTSDQTVMTQLPGALSPVPFSAKFNDSPAFIFLVVALVVASFYALISTLVSISLLLRPQFTAQFSVYITSLDTVMLGILALATGTAGGVALKGNEDSGRIKICNVYDKFCRYFETSLALSLFASLLLLFLSILSALSKRSP